MSSVIGATLAFVFTVFAGAVQQGTPADEAAIRQIAESFQQHWGDAAALAKLYSRDAKYTGSTGVKSIGRANIKRNYATQFAGQYKGTSLRFVDIAFKFTDANTAAASSTFELSGVKLPDGKLVPVRRIISVTKLTKQNGQWFIVELTSTVPKGQ